MRLLFMKSWLFPKQALDLGKNAARVFGHVLDVQLALHRLDDGLDQLIVQLDAQDIGDDFHRILLDRKSVV